MTITRKAVATQPANIKRMDNGAVIATLPKDGWIFGNLSVTGSDIIDVLKWYRPTGQEMALPYPCKVSVTNLKVTLYTEPTVPPVEPPTTTGIIINIRKSNDGGNTWYESRYYEEISDPNIIAAIGG